MEGLRGKSFYEDGDELDLTPQQVQDYFKKLKEIEWGYKGKAVITSVPEGPNYFYEIFVNQNNKEN